MGIQIGKGVQIGRSVNPDPLLILGPLAWWVRADQGITIATGVSQWNDLSGNARHFTQATGANQPLFVSSAINGQPALRGDGSNDFLATSWSRVAPGTQPFYIWCIFKQITWTSGRGLLGDYNPVNPSGFTFQQAVGVTPTLTQYCGNNVNINNAGTLGSYFRLESLFNNTTSSYLKIGSVTNTGANSGNNANQNSMQLFCLGNGSNFGNVEIAEAFAFLGTPTSQNRIDLDAYCTARYGAGLV